MKKAPVCVTGALAFVAVWQLSLKQASNRCHMTVAACNRGLRLTGTASCSYFVTLRFTKHGRPAEFHSTSLRALASVASARFD